MYDFFLRPGITRPRKAAEVIGHEVKRAHGQVIKDWRRQK